MSPDQQAPRKLLFVCIENSNRSQMASAFAKILGASMGLGVIAYSAGSRPSGIVNPKAIAAMAELGYDLSTHESKSLDEVPHAGYDAVITMGCGDACPFVEGRLHEDWALPDPRHMEPEAFRKVRDEIRDRVGDLLRRL
jgi:arsenate reductase